MKANKAPKKLYFGRHEGSLLDTYSKKEAEDEIEYVRTDAFIEKACEAFCKVRCQGKPPRSTCTSLGTCREYDDFRKAMREEGV